jgi:hypothetical protein
MEEYEGTNSPYLNHEVEREIGNSIKSANNWRFHGPALRRWHPDRNRQFFATLTVTIRDPAIARHRAAHGVDASSDLLVASWPPDPNAAADGNRPGSGEL